MNKQLIIPFFKYVNNKNKDLFINKMKILKPLCEQLANRNINLLDERNKKKCFQKIYFIIYCIQNIDYVEELIPKLKEFDIKDNNFLKKLISSNEFEYKYSKIFPQIITISRKDDNSEVDINLENYNLDELYDNIRNNFNDFNDDVKRMDYYNFNGLMNENTYTNYNILDELLFCLYYMIYNR